MECNEGVMAEGNRTSMWVDKRTTERHIETWWWNDEVAKAIEEKIRCYMSMSMSTVDFYSASPHPPLMRYMQSVFSE